MQITQGSSEESPVASLEVPTNSEWKASRPLLQNSESHRSVLAKLLLSLRPAQAFSPPLPGTQRTPHRASLASQIASPLRSGRPQASVVTALNVKDVNLKLISDRILVELNPEPETTKSGIVMPTVFTDDNVAEWDGGVPLSEVMAEKGVLVGDVKGLGPGLTAEDGSVVPMGSLEVGQKLVIAPVIGQEFLQEDEIAGDAALSVFRTEDIWGVVTPEEDAGQKYTLNNFVLPGPIKALGNNILIKWRPSDQASSGGILLSVDEAEKQQREAIVVSAGPGRFDPHTGKLVPNPCKDGDVVLLTGGLSDRKVLSYMDEEYMILDARKVLGTFDDNIISLDTFHPIGQNIMIINKKATEETISGITITASEVYSDQGTASKVGPGMYSGEGELVPNVVTPGMSVLLPSDYTDGEQVKIKTDTFKLVKEEDVLSWW